MTPAVATRIAQAAKSMPSKPKAFEAAALVREWLRAEGLQQDRFGNWKRPGIDDKRYQLTEKVLRDQYRNERGEWLNRDSGSLIDAAYDLIGQAAIVLEDPELSGRVLKATGKRKEVAETQKLREDRKERENLAKELALRSLAASHRDELFRLWVSGGLPPNEERQLDQMRLVHYDRFLELLESGGDPADLDEGGAAASAKLPPLLPLRFAAEYFWIEEVSGKKYPIHIWRGNRTTHVDLGWGTGPRIGETPSKLIRSRLSERHGAVPVRLRGEIEQRDGKLRATLDVLGTAPGQEPGRDPTELWVSRQQQEHLLVMLKQAVYLWCTMLEGYKIRWFRYDTGMYSELAALALRELVASGTLVTHDVGDEGDNFHTFSWTRIRQ